MTDPLDPTTVVPASTLRRALDGLYIVSAYVGAAFVVAIGVLITAQVVGRELGVQVVGADDLTAWSVVAAGFLPLAYTYRTAGHIRVTLLVDQNRGTTRRIWEIVVMAIALFFVGFLCYSAFDMIRDAIRFGDMTQGLIVIPMFIPQLSMPIGTLILVIAIIDDLVVAMRGGPISYLEAERSTERADITHAD